MRVWLEHDSVELFAPPADPVARPDADTRTSADAYAGTHSHACSCADAYTCACSDPGAGAHACSNSHPTADSGFPGQVPGAGDNPLHEELEVWQRDRLDPENPRG